MTLRRRHDERTDDTTNEVEMMNGPLSRRNFLAAAGVGGAAVAAVAATGGIHGAGAAVVSASQAQAATTTTVAGARSSGGSTSTGSAAGDVATGAFAASLEVLAVATYQAALDAARAGKLGAVPPAGAQFVVTALAQHQAQLDRWNEILTAVGQPAVTTPEPKLKAVVDQAFPQVTDFVGVAKLARTLEETAAATYLKAIPALKSKAIRQLAGSIQIVDAQHVAILNYVLGEYPVPDVFAKTDKAATP